MEGVFKHRIFGMRRKEKARKEKKPVDWAYPIFRHQLIFSLSFRNRFNRKDSE